MTHAAKQLTFKKKEIDASKIDSVLKHTIRGIVDSVKGTFSSSVADDISEKKNHPAEAKEHGINASFNAMATELRGGIFASEEEYERVTNSVVARIRSGEIQPCEPDDK